jgi:hypothetical protein
MRTSASCFLLAIALAPFAVHCGGAAFDSASPAGGSNETGGSPGGTGGSATGGWAGGTGGHNSGGTTGSGGGGAGIIVVDSGPADVYVPPPDVTPPPLDGSGCAALPNTATDVYVDQRYTGAMMTGAATCPYRTITDGLHAAGALVGTRTVHVAGATTGLVYREADALMVNTNVVLLGAGPAQTTILVPASTSGSSYAVAVEGGAVLDGFTISTPTGDGVLMASAMPAPIARNVSASFAKGNGIVVLGTAEIGPMVMANNNGANGVYAKASGLVHIAWDPAKGPNAFDNNGTNGVSLEGTAWLAFDGGSVSGNTGMGVRLAGSVSPTHVITSLTAKANKGAGVMVSAGQSLQIRGSVLAANTTYGLYYAYASSAGVLDLGPNNQKGGNTFGGGWASRNTLAGIYLCKSRGQGTQAANGNFWSACPPTQIMLAGCDTLPGGYADVAYAPAVGGDPVYDSTCSVGP